MSKSKEEILDKTHWDFVVEHGISSIHSKTFPSAYQEQAMLAMDEHSRQQSIAFGEWISGNGYFYYEGKKWIRVHDDSGGTSEELYDLFIQSQQNKQS